MSRVKFGVCEFSFPCWGPLALQMAHEAGFTGMQLADAGGSTNAYPLNNKRVQDSYLETAAKYGITIVIEPVRMPDCNIINTFAEGVQLAKTVGLDNVKVLIDFYHMVCEKENPEVLRKYGKEYLRHVHFSYPSIPEIDGVRDPDNIRTIFEGELHRRGWWRTFPSCREEWDYTDFIQALTDCGYQGRVSLEAPVTDFDRQAQEALAFMKAEF